MTGKQATVSLLPANSFFLQFQTGVVSNLTFNLTPTGNVTVDPSQANVLTWSRTTDGETLTVSDYQDFTSPIFGDIFIEGPIFDRWKRTASQTTGTGQNLQAYLGTPLRTALLSQTDSPCNASSAAC